MPVYEYRCEEHGGFEEILPISRYNEAVCCPSCGVVATKVCSAPKLRGMSKVLMSSHEKNERSREAPHVCKTGCSHSHGHKSPNKAKAKGRDGEPVKPMLQSYRGRRPWVIEHA